MWTRGMIEDMLTKSDRAVERAILCIYRRQTTQEQAAHATLMHNNRGFASSHARLGTYWAEWLKSGKHLTGKHLEKARRVSMKYHRQLVEEANRTEAAKAAAPAPAPVQATLVEAEDLQKTTWYNH